MCWKPPFSRKLRDQLSLSAAISAAFFYSSSVRGLTSFVEAASGAFSSSILAV
jgi:hypothetical protein